MFIVGYDRYQWKRDGVDITLSTADNTGTVIIQDPTDRDAGLYQCSARNSVGKAISNTTLVVRSERARFPDYPVQNKTATIGESLRLNCQPDRQSVPSPSFTDFSWEDNRDDHWPLSRRVQIDDNGMYENYEKMRNFKANFDVNMCLVLEHHRVCRMSLEFAESI